MNFTLTGALLGFLCSFVIGNLRGTIEPAFNLNTIETDLGYMLPFVAMGAPHRLGGRSLGKAEAAITNLPQPNRHSDRDLCRGAYLARSWVCGMAKTFEFTEPDDDGSANPRAGIL
jgi:hypothetical protein